MQSDNSLPLFSWAQRSAAITPFPHSRRIGKVRQVAETLLERKTERTRENYRKKTLSRLRSKMRKLGLSEQVIETEIKKFESALIAELNRLSFLESCT